MFLYLFVAVILGRIILLIISKIDLTAWKFNPKEKTKYVAGLFVNNYVDSKVLFMAIFKQVPSLGVVTLIDVTKAYALITEKFGNEILDIHQATMFDHDKGNLFFNMTIFELRDKRMIELGNGYAEIFYTRLHRDWACALLKELAKCKIEADFTEEKAPTVIGFARVMEMN